MLLYDWDKIYNAADSNPVEIVRILRMLVKKQVPNNFHDPIYKYYGQTFMGQSFLLHPDTLVNCLHRHTYRHVSMYLSLASLRPWADWVTSKKLTLDAITVPVESDKLDALVAENDMLDLTDGVISFFYEDIGGATLH